MTRKNHSRCMVATALFFVLSAVFLGLYVSERFSNREVKQRQCEDMLSNQTLQSYEQLRSLRKSMEAVQQNWEEAKREKDQLNATLVALNNSRVESKEGWDACLNQLDSLKGNFTSQVVDIQQEREDAEEKLKRLQQELQKKSQELENLKRELQQEREMHQTEIQKLKAERKSQDPNHSNGKAADGPSTIITTVLLFAVPSLVASFQH